MKTPEQEAHDSALRAKCLAEDIIRMVEKRDVSMSEIGAALTVMLADIAIRSGLSADRAADNVRRVYAHMVADREVAAAAAATTPKPPTTLH